MNRNRKRERKGKDRRDGIWTATVPACSTAHADCWGKKRIEFGRGEERWTGTIFLFLLFLCSVFSCVYDHFSSFNLILFGFLFEKVRETRYISTTFYHPGA
jgi:hypothetical protein